MKAKETPGVDMIIKGWLARDPEYTVTTSGKQICSWSIPYKFVNKKTGEELTKWYTCKAFDELALYVAENFRARMFGRFKVSYVSLWKDNKGNVKEDYMISKVVAEAKEPDFGPSDDGGYDGPPI